MQSLRNPPTFSSDTEVSYMDTVTMYCVVDGGQNVTRQRRCLFDVENQVYTLLGDPLDCPGKAM